MQTRIIEATDGVLYGKFLLGRFDQEWQRRALIEGESSWPLLRQEGWGPEHILVLDLSSPGNGSIFHPGAARLPEADFAKRRLDV